MFCGLNTFILGGSILSFDLQRELLASRKEEQILQQLTGIELLNGHGELSWALFGGARS